MGRALDAFENDDRDLTLGETLLLRAVLPQAITVREFAEVTGYAKGNIQPAMWCPARIHLA